MTKLKQILVGALTIAVITPVLTLSNLPFKLLGKVKAENNMNLAGKGDNCLECKSCLNHPEAPENRIV